MGPTQSRISRKDVPLGLRSAWREQPAAFIINGMMVAALTALLIAGSGSFPGWAIVLTGLVILTYLLDTGYQIYRGLDAARDARDFDTYISNGGWGFNDLSILDPWSPLDADFRDERQ